MAVSSVPKATWPHGSHQGRASGGGGGGGGDGHGDSTSDRQKAMWPKRAQRCVKRLHEQIPAPAASRRTLCRIHADACMSSAPVERKACSDLSRRRAQRSASESQGPLAVD